MDYDHWADDPYWTEAADSYYAYRAAGKKLLALDFSAIERVAFDGDGPAYRLFEAMDTVRRREGMEGFRGAPRLLLALLMRLNEISEEAGPDSP